VRIALFPKGYLDQLTVERTMSVFDWIELARAVPADGLELYSEFLSLDDHFIDRVRIELDRAGFQMPMLCTAPDFTHPDPATRAAEIARQARLIEVAARIGGPGVSCRVLSGQAHPEIELEQGLEWATGAIEGLLPLARELDVTLALENHYKASSWTYPEFAQRPAVFYELLRRIPERVHFGVQYDPSNAIVAGVDSAEFLESVIERVVTMQASDRHLADGTDLESLRLNDGTIGYSPSLLHGVVGQGLNDYDRIFHTLAREGYDGWISIEDGVNGLDEMIESARFLQDARERYFGGSTEVSVRHHELARNSR
jgi:sugar phosphate isomerase/epimerase